MQRHALAAACCLFLALPAIAQFTLTTGPAPHQVLQVGPHDTAAISLSGTAANGPIEARLLNGATEILPWKPIATATGGTWSATLNQLPLGGPYTLELREEGAAHTLTTAGPFFCGDLWVLAGQSNMQGVGNNQAITPPHPRVMVFAMNDQWRPAEEPLHRLAESVDIVHNKNAPADGSTAPPVDTTHWRKGAGLGLAFATAITEATARPIGLLACAHGGTSMTQWDPTRRDEGGESLYGAMYRRVQAAGGTVTGILWYQGESDANADAAPLYKNKFRNFIEATRADFNNPHLPFYYVQIGRFTQHGDSIHWDAIQHAQYELPAEMSRVRMVSAIDLTLDDNIHIDTQGLQTLGLRLARLALTEVYGTARFQQGPRLAAITREETPAGRYYRLQFQTPNGALTSHGPLLGFTLYDTEGKQRSFKQDRHPLDPASIRLWLLQFPETAYLYYGRGYDPACTVLDSAAFAMPAFGPIFLRE